MQEQQENISDNPNKAKLNIERVSDRLFWGKYLLVAWVGCLLMLMVIFTQRIRHEKRINEIFDKYHIEMNKLHNGR